MANSVETLQSCICVVLFTYLGVVTRLALTMLSEVAKDSQLPNLGTGFFLPNICGSFIMGLAVPLEAIFRGRTYWYLGLTSGFCGSCTTFSTWQKVSATLMVNGHVVDSILYSLLTFCTSFMAYLCGRHLGDGLSLVLRKVRTPLETPRGPPKVASLNLDVVIVLMAIILLTVALWTGVFMDPVDWRRQWWVAMALGPVGSLTRFLTSLHNKKFPNFPVFTFMVNIGASVIAMLFLVIQHFRTSKAYEFWAIDGVGTGLLGALSTVSTLVNELYKLCSQERVAYAYRYGVATVVVAQVLCIAVGCVAFIK